MVMEKFKNYCPLDTWDCALIYLCTSEELLEFRRVGNFVL